jgi:hypothetical protein
LAAFAFAIIVPGFIYWIVTRANVAKCIYGDPVCSLTLSTYLLCALTAFVFLASLIGVRYAKETFERERRAVLSIERCARESCTHGVKTYFIRDPSEGFLWTRPQSFDKDRFGLVDVDCLSVGKSPVINGVLRIALNDEPTKPLTLPIGSMKSGSEGHVRIWFSREFLNYKMTWALPTHDGDDLSFYALEDGVVPAYRYPYSQYPEEEGPLSPLPPAPPPKPADLEPPDAK